MQPVFDGHNDALTRQDHALIATGRPQGHLDLPRTREGDVRGGIFAVFTDGGRDDESVVARGDGLIEFEYSPPLDHVIAAAEASAAAGPGRPRARRSPAAGAERGRPGSGPSR